MPSEPLPSPKPSDRALSPYERLRNAIVDGTLAPGAPLVESQVAQWCEVSRTPVREALMRLEQDGLVERGDRGLVVRQRSPEEILDIYEARIVLEMTIARTAAERHTRFDRIQLERLTRRFEATPVDDTELVARNREFHHGVWVASHNDALIDLLSRIDLHLVKYPATTLSYPGRIENAQKQHQQLVEAIIERDADSAGEIARTHFVEARDIRLALWQEEIY